ncbi:ethanolaminephosphotransferase 1 isoform X2 [Sitodiplosis mosellana]|uniref:ethanolaminephosphotransferase 1 isoform X2 n=2 Tax=Sitodiplosis mosellana TaxID=263140 RepID=UPI0024439210|nr:ethanolaminephosphotransferase 1 isoform X2 [Sitodiplosis mosellana]
MCLIFRALHFFKMSKTTYLRDEHRRGFDNYKYSCVDTSFLSRNIMHPFWNYLVQFFPRWVAPNLITFTGFLLTIVNFLLIGYYDFNFNAANDHSKSVIPDWVWIVASINIFVAYTLDGIDGKQARRTGTSGPLGELFDHGVDSYSAALIPIYMFSIFGTDQISPLRMHFIIWNVFLNFYLTHFEKYNTGVLYLPWAYDFTMWGVTIVLMITGIFGIEMWRFTLPGGYTPAFAFEMTLYISGLISSHPFIIYRIIVSYTKRTGKMRPFIEAVRPLFPFVLLFIITTIWVIFSRNNILSREPRILFLLFGTIFSNISCRLIVAQMSDTRADGFNHLICLVIIVFGLSVAPLDKFDANITIDPDIEKTLVYCLAAIATLMHFHFGYGVVREMCDHFKIRCFKIPPQPPQSISI